MALNEDTVDAAVGLLEFHFALTGIQAIELGMLLELGCTVGDVESALDAWSRAHHVDDDWGYIRTVLFTRQAEWRLRSVELNGSAGA